jgi:hypothetical protein
VLKINLFVSCDFRLNVKGYLRNNAIWTDHIKPKLPTSPLQLRRVSVLGIAALYSLFTSCEGFSVVAKTTFVAHCIHRDETLGLFVQFVDFCFRLRLTTDAEVSVCLS